MSATAANTLTTDPRTLRTTRAKELGLKTDGLPLPKIANDIFEETVEDTLRGPVFVHDYPVAVCPLAKQSPEDPRIAERFELFVAGMEMGNAFSELNDPQDQERRFNNGSWIDHRIDVNTVLPTGGANPNFGKAFAEAMLEMEKK